MKKLMNKILASMLTMAMFIGMFAGVGLEAKAAVGDDQCDVRVMNESKEAVKGISLVLENKVNKEDTIAFDLATDDTGDASCFATHAGTYILKPAESSGYVAVNTVEIVISTTGNNVPYFDTVNGSEFDFYSDYVELTVKPVTTTPTITSVSTSATSVSKDGGTVDIIVVGENLPDTLYYKRGYMWKDTGSSDLISGTVDYSGQSVNATGTSTEKTISVPLAAASGTYSKAREWSISVGLEEDGTFKKLGSNIAIDGIEEIQDPVITEVTTSKSSVSTNGETITVTVTGQALPNEVYYKVCYLWDNGGTLTPTAISYTGTKITLTGNDATSKTFEVVIPNEKETENTQKVDVKGWQVQVSLMQYNGYVKSGNITIEGSSEPTEPTEPQFDGKTLSVKVIDENNVPVSGVQLCLKSTDQYMDIPVINMGATDQDGAISYVCQNNEDTYEPYELMPVTSSDYTCDSPLNVKFSYESGSYSKTIISTIDNANYTGEEKTLVVKQKTPEAVINSVTTYPISISKDGGDITVTVRGENLPSTLYYKRYYVVPDDFGGTYDNYLDANAQLVNVESADATMKMFTVSLPALSSDNKYKDASAWKIGVGTSESASFRKSSAITINDIEVPATPEITSVIPGKTIVNSTGESITVTVNGQALPESVYYKLCYLSDINGTLYPLSVNAGTIKLVGDDVTSKTFEILIPDKLATEAEEQDEVKGWQIQVSLQQYSGYVKSDNITFKAEESSVTDETKQALSVEIVEIESINEKDFTAESWKAYKDAVDLAKILVEKENATETECQEALNAIADAKAGLKKIEKPAEPVVKDVKVSGINVTGAPSKIIAAGKKIRLAAEVAPANASNKAVVWTSSNSKYATVDATGKVTVKKAGAGKSVVITATAKDGSKVSGSIKISIKKHAVKSIKLKASKTVKAGKKIKVKATVKTTGKSVNKKLKWTVSNSAYAKVTSNGTVKTLKAGRGKKVKVTATATDGSGKKKSVTIKIK